MRRVYVKPPDEREFLRTLLKEGWYVKAGEEDYKIYDEVTVCWFSTWEDEPATLRCQVIGRCFQGTTTRILKIKIRPHPLNENEARMRLGRFR